MISAYGSGKQWQKAEQMFEEMQRIGVEPSVVVYSAMITAYGKGDQWQKAEQVFVQLQSRGLEPGL
jgi:pentatricopeptide repeat domain-containing protein 1